MSGTLTSAPQRSAPPLDLLVEELASRQARITPTAEDRFGASLAGLSRQVKASPGLLEKPAIQIAVAYALQDFEKMHGRMDGTPARIREFLENKATTIPGLTNDRASDLLKATARIDSPKLVHEIRTFATKLSKQAQQENPTITSQIEALESRIRTAPRAPGPDRATTSQALGAVTTAAISPSATTRAPTDAATRSTGGSPNASKLEPANTANEASPRAPTQPPQSQQNADAARQSGPGARGNMPGHVAAPIQTSILDTVLRAMRPDGRQPRAPWEPASTPMLDRLAAIERHIAGEKNEKTFQTAEASGRAALQALQGFATTEGAAVMGKIQAAASSTPGGMKQVLSEMREGGQFADLRKEFGSALSADAGFAAAYDKAASSLAAYGKNRMDAQEILVKTPEANALTKRFEKLDSEIGAAASATPSKNEGRSMLEDMTKQAAELLKSAVAAVKSAFTRSADPSAGASPSPSPS